MAQAETETAEIGRYANRMERQSGYCRPRHPKTRRSSGRRQAPPMSFGVTASAIESTHPYHDVHQQPNVLRCPNRLADHRFPAGRHVERDSPDLEFLLMGGKPQALLQFSRRHPPASRSRRPGIFSRARAGMLDLRFGHLHRRSIRRGSRRSMQCRPRFPPQRRSPIRGFRLGCSVFGKFSPGRSHRRFHHWTSFSAGQLFNIGEFPARLKLRSWCGEPRSASPVRGPFRCRIVRSSHRA